jgi:CRP/FNR family transcriptional regulator
LETNKCKDCKFQSPATEVLSESELEVLAKNCAEVQFGKREIIFKQNALSSNIAYLKKGYVKLFMKGASREQILKIVKAPAYLGIPTTIGDKINHYSAMALDDTQVCFIDIRVFTKFLRSNPDFSYEIILNLCRNEIDQFHRCINLTQKQLYGRFAGTLLDMAENLYENNSFQPHLNRIEFADLIGTSRESISRLFTEFSNSGIISYSGKTITILNKSVLESISQKG